MFQHNIGIKHEGIQQVYIQCPKLVGTFYTYSLLRVLYACEVVYTDEKNSTQRIWQEHGFRDSTACMKKE